LSSLFILNDKIDGNEFEKIDIKEFFRVDKVDKLFHLGNVSLPISIIYPGPTLSTETHLKLNSDGDEDIFQWSNANHNLTEFNNDFIPKLGTQYFNSPIKPYRFKDNIQFRDTGNIVNLTPVHGNNLLKVIQHNPGFKETIEHLTADYGFEINIDTERDELFIQLRINKGLVYSVPYKAIADTFKRLLFHVAAIRYSNGSVITLDEPDAHSFPKYVSFLADEIIESVNKQFFIATHSPYLLNNLIENTPAADLKVFVCGYDKNKSSTIVKELSREDLSELIGYGVDIFFNINRYLDDRIEYSS
jgi:AAA15 family ATPase/GTPase